MIAPRYCEMNVVTKSLSSPFKTPYSSTIGFGYLRGINYAMMMSGYRRAFTAEDCRERAS